ncbi:MAG: P63C domain-containing protein [Acidobacteriota bacterium]
MTDESVQSKGGKARALQLSKEDRSAIASAAAEARWGKSGKDRVPVPKADFGSPDRPLRIGELEIPCYVLEDGRSVITQGGMLSAMNMGRGTATKGGGDRIANFANTNAIKPFVSKELSHVIMEPIRFKYQGMSAYGYEATILPDLCEAVLQARDAGKLHYQQEHIAKQCEILVRAFARVGIVALVHEVTGYQETRDREALQELLKRYISEELLGWVRTFPMEFYKQIFRLKGWNWNAGRMSPIMGNIVNDLVYGRLAPGVLDELKKRNPVTEKGYRQHQHFQHLTADVGHPQLTRHLYELIGMSRAFAAGEWDKFYVLVNRTFPKNNATMMLPFPELEA